MAQLRDKNGRFVRTTPDYKALYEAEWKEHQDAAKEVKKLREDIERKQRLHEIQLSGLKQMYDDAVAHMGWLRRLIFGFRAV